MPELSEDQRERFWEAIACTFLDTTTYSEQQEGECEASIASLIAEAQREAAQAVLDAVEAVHPKREAGAYLMCDECGTVGYPCDSVDVARAAAAKYGAGTAAGEPECSHPAWTHIGSDRYCAACGVDRDTLPAAGGDGR